MNKHNIVQTGGYPLKTERLQELQTSFEVFNALGEIAGNYAIIKGCTVNGNNTTNGEVYINGEVFSFVGGTTQSNVKILQDAVSRPFENGELKDVYYKRYVTFASGPESIPWVNFKRPKTTIQLTEQKAEATDLQGLATRIELLEAKNAVFQAGGGMVLWNKPVAQIPNGWAEVVNWRGRMPIGWNPNDYDFNLVGETGGEKTKTLSTDNIPAHYHHKPGSPFDSFAARADRVSGANSISKSPDATEENNELAIGNIGTNYAPGGIAKEQTVGRGLPFSLLNPYRVVLFIEWVGID